MKDTFCSYYTNSSDITSYMVRRLTISQNDIILEPSAGEGIFIDEILKLGVPVQIDAIDINEKAISILEKKYKHNDAIRIQQTDTLIDEQLDYLGLTGGYYDKVIGNPPYGAWQDYDKRDLLKTKYPGQYVKETYSLFILRCISMLKLGGRLSFIIPDTFMFLNMHSQLREVLLTMTKIEEIITFPSNFFPGISFGYSNLAIITLQKAEKNDALNNIIKVVQGFQNISEFNLLFEVNDLPEHLKIFKLTQASVYSNPQHRFILAQNNILDLLNNSTVNLGDVADIVTGFYTGDNKRFIRVKDHTIKGSKAYEEINPNLVFSCTSLKGIENVSEGYIPYVKSASPTRYYRTDDDWYVRWDRETIEFYNQNKKTRFQNSGYYFKTGVAIPMVKASNIRAFLIEKRVFDQSIVGIFPKDISRLYYILALMNSNVINRIIHTINPTANNSANYIKQIPYIEPENSVLKEIETKVKLIIENNISGEKECCEKVQSEINSIINKIYGIQD